MIDQFKDPLARIRFVLVETTHPGNIGAAARALKTMGLSRMELVAPKQPPDAESLARASGADDLLASAGIHPTLTEALAGCRLVIGASARLRTIEWPLLDPGECARRLIAEGAEGDVAVVLGRESSGLTNDELARCHYLVHIPTNPEFSSLNLAAAVQVLAYEIRRSLLEAAGAPLEEEPREVATADEMEGFYDHLVETLMQIGFSDPEQSRTLMKRLRRLFNRARPDRVEMNILRGILSAAQGRKSPGRFARSDQAADAGSASASEEEGAKCSRD
ncbi:tRNA (cytosine(32)/uridine(32)-2'-O)-methyltransferase TrmJ [Thiorhodococcus mannitoliphagus]|uniref:tRNA (cytidine/uridine-2'-O-)-methyltransferase TrmJ n=1 Tax=Thiorhodococcus mannitoliphagus TaxID=329406 RepID=A0A6P1DXX5_9GAMM|nr:tRNA (cytosine(32)/uridine(32)-2'-O)-methyltransferase TrmJ [Thiorhodococcus mannitoliphagus]NEX22330.1 tRNA (cytosine(32)/uridine(32)-2'-O)-methyltransferase TrmJ [Thiorhodococcus mannitoliphagus]